MRRVTIEIERDHRDHWRWRMVMRNGRIVATASEGYTRRRAALQNLRFVTGVYVPYEVIKGKKSCFKYAITGRGTL